MGSNNPTLIREQPLAVATINAGLHDAKAEKARASDLLTGLGFLE